MDFECPEIEKVLHHEGMRRWEFTAPDGVCCMIAEQVIEMAADPKQLVISVLEMYRATLNNGG